MASLQLTNLLLTKIYSDDTTPYGPVNFLATTWRASAELAGYAQQDAHEFFISALNQIHSTCRGSTNVSCNCIIHSTFAGLLQSEVKCERCGTVTSTVDPMLDISLELEGKGGKVASGENSLAACLRRYSLCCASTLISGTFDADLRNPKSLAKNIAVSSAARLLMYIRFISPVVYVSHFTAVRRPTSDSAFESCPRY